MSTGTDISSLYREFTDALAEVLAENAGKPVRRGRLARARAAVKRHTDYSEHEYFLAVETAFAQWEQCKMLVAKPLRRYATGNKVKILRALTRHTAPSFQTDGQCPLTG